MVRRIVRAQLPPIRPLTVDPLCQMAGADDFEPAAVDDVVYG